MATIRTEKPGNSLESGFEIGERIQGALEDAQSRLSEAGERLSKATKHAREVAGDKVESLGTLMSKHPVATICVGLGVGFVVGRFLMRD